MHIDSVFGNIIDRMKEGQKPRGESDSFKASRTRAQKRQAFWKAYKKTHPKKEDADGHDDGRAAKQPNVED